MTVCLPAFPLATRFGTALLLGCIATFAGCAATARSSLHDDPSADPITRLKNGNERWVRGWVDHPHADPARRQSVATQGQHPFATIISCSDSRVPVELVLDAGIGDLFIIRVAGNVCAVDETGSIEYAVEHMKTPLLVVLGHSKCGAVTAACHHDVEHGSVSELIERIQPAVRRAEAKRANLSDDDFIDLAIHENVKFNIEELMRRSEVVRTAVGNHTLHIVGGVYDLYTGRIEWLPGESIMSH